MKLGQEILRSTIDTIENKYMKNCHPDYIEHWIKIRTRVFKDLIELQLEEFDRCSAT